MHAGPKSQILFNHSNLDRNCTIELNAEWCKIHVTLFNIFSKIMCNKDFGCLLTNLLSWVFIYIMCGSRKYPYPPHGWLLDITRVWGISKVKILKGKYEAKLEFLEGLGATKKKKTSMGEAWIFSGTTQWTPLQQTHFPKIFHVTSLHQGSTVPYFITAHLKS